MSLEMTGIQKWLLKIILKKNEVNREDLLMEYKIPRSTAYDNLSAMEKMGILERAIQNHNGRGRPYIIWRLKKN